jgi:hypothetical protein
VCTWCGEICAREHLCAHPLRLLTPEGSKKSLGRPNPAPARRPRFEARRTELVESEADWACACSSSSRPIGTGTPACARQPDRLPLTSTPAVASAFGVAEHVRLAHRCCRFTSYRSRPVLDPVESVGAAPFSDGPAPIVRRHAIDSAAELGEDPSAHEWVASAERPEADARSCRQSTPRRRRPYGVARLGHGGLPTRYPGAGRAVAPGATNPQWCTD